jgi:hypothetical protein
MSRVGFEPTIPVFERAKTVDAFDRAATVIGHPARSRLQSNTEVYGPTSCLYLHVCGHTSELKYFQTIIINMCWFTEEFHYLGCDTV